MRRRRRLAQPNEPRLRSAIVTSVSRDTPYFLPSLDMLAQAMQTPAQMLQCFTSSSRSKHSGPRELRDTKCDSFQLLI
ncbi:hypothetical protein BCR34DRAFT_304903 [Clohesyomyces aquaticus]|uniref:Uncharacterized protein n=1 Tax=Clohesyomyces aquaticus TaxID=1231657 RepID=A0A1Y1ZPL8_9PLEO|nr:hypothetical protein BCR34DRAFT_304903 [Clohesyomyces aquaticus]